MPSTARTYTTIVVSLQKELVLFTIHNCAPLHMNAIPSTHLNLCQVSSTRPPAIDPSTPINTMVSPTLPASSIAD